MFRRGTLVVMIGATAFLAGDSLLAQDQKSGAASEKAGAAGSKEAGGAGSEEGASSPSSGLQGALAKLIPEGQSSLNVTIPNLADGILKTLVTAASITRQDDENLAMVALVIEMYDAQGDVELSINMETAVYHLPTGILESERPTQISNDQFDLTGEEGLVYDSNTQQGKLPGKVTMIVYNLEESAGKEQSKDE